MVGNVNYQPFPPKPRRSSPLLIPAVVFGGLSFLCLSGMFFSRVNAPNEEEEVARYAIDQAAKERFGDEAKVDYDAKATNMGDHRWKITGTLELKYNHTRQFQSEVVILPKPDKEHSAWRVTQFSTY